MKYVTLIFLLFFMNILVSGQHNEYYKDQNTIFSNIEIIEGAKTENFAYCRVKKDDQITRYYPGEIVEYGLGDGRVFIAKEISLEKTTSKVFLQRLIDGKSKLYYYCANETDMFFVEDKDGTLVYLNKKDGFRDILTEFTKDCAEISSKTKFVTYNKRILSNFLLEYNACKSLHLQRLRFGVFAGMVHTKPVTIKMPSEIDGNFTFTPSNNIYYGIFMNLPIYSSDFSLYSSIGFLKSSYSSSFSTNNYDAGIQINHYSLLVPVIVRYTPLKGRISPYLNVGLNYLYNLKNENILYKAISTGNTIQFEYLEEQVFANHAIGCTFGAGFQYEINFKRAVFVELNFNKEFSIGQPQSMYNRNIIQLTSGINL